MTNNVSFFDGPNGARIYQIATRAFARMITYAYLVVDGDYVALIDTGSGDTTSNNDLEMGFAALRTEWNERLEWGDLSRIIITHGHIDHYGGLTLVREHSNAPIAMHPLDAPVVRDVQAAMAVQIQATAAFLRSAGIGEAAIGQLSTMFEPAVQGMAGWEVTTLVQGGDLLDERFVVTHVPGHCPGQIALTFGDVVFCADHILSQTNPRLTPASLEAHNGLAAYLDALDRVAALPNLRLALAGHEDPITDVYGRIDAIRASHLQRLDQVWAVCAEPHTLLELTASVYPQMNKPAHLLLALQSTATRLEYLQQRGSIIATATQRGTCYQRAGA